LISEEIPGLLGYFNKVYILPCGLLIFDI